ncbi:hypothetical protein MJA45_03790 [Paenibacillus aurantius]|uniref:Uncharacterized protein n=1 Tax=Paenibacillus aurantius TaxID=2918900 RepID=A0AA96LFF2_9BACL|nr:hypothetical protein [Paenibacillus aurantius]WNQ12184.1 hypothetical protein MJA45_03790 [Paenibacillus aurantius]
MLIMLGIAVFLMKVFSSDSNEPALFYIGGSDESVRKEPSEKSVLGFSVSFDNPTNHSFTIDQVVPLLNERGKRIVLGEVESIQQEKRLQAGKKVEYSGEIDIRTSDLTEEEIHDMLPLLEGYRIILNQGEEIILRTKH